MELSTLEPIEPRPAARDDAGRRNRQLFLDTLHELGVGEQSARGALGSLAWESGQNLKNDSNNAGDGADGSDSIGWGQWNSTRAVNLKRTAAALGVDWTDPRAQSQHIKNELTGPYKHVLDALKANDDVYHGADVWTRHYEVPKVKNVGERYQRAVQLANLDGVLTSAPRALTPTTGLGDGVDPQTMAVRPYSDHTATDVWTPPIEATPEERMRKREEDAARIAATPFSQTLADAYSTGSITGSVLRAGSLRGFDPDVNYRLTTEELEARTTNLAPPYHDWFAQAVSSDHADAIQRAAEQHQASSQRLHEQGWKGLAAEGLAMVLDPTAIAVGIGTGGLGNVASAAARLGKVGHVALNAGLGAASNVALDKGLEALGDPEHHDLILSALMGAALGGAYGVFSKAPHADRLSRRATRDIEDIVGPRERQIIDDPNGPTPDRPEVIRPTDKPTGRAEIDDAIRRANDDWDAIDRADEIFRRRVAEREGQRPRPTTPPQEPGAPPLPPERPLGPNEVVTQVVNESTFTRAVAQFVEAMAAKFGITDLIRVGDIRNHPSPQVRSAFGVATPWRDGSFSLHVNPDLPPAMIAETVAHEFGHIHDMVKHGMRLYGDSTEAIGGAVNRHPALKEAHAAWTKRANKQTAEEFHGEYFGPAAQRRMPVGENEAGRLAKDTMLPKFWGYRTSHQEWFAQEWAKWVASSEHPRTTADRFWKGVADFWKRIYYIATGETPANVPTEAFKGWVNGHYNENAVPAKGRIGREAALALEGGEGPREAIGEPVVYPGRPTLSAEGGLGTLRQGDVARTSLGGMRFSIAGVLGKSDNPAVRALGGLLVEDNVGKQGGAVTPHSAELYKRQKVNSSITRIAQARKPAWDVWRKENGLSWIEARNREGEFESTVAEAMRLPNSSAEFQALPNWAKTYAQHLSKIADEVRQHMNEPFLTEGLLGRPVDGFGAVLGDEKYLMRAWSARKIADVVDAKGYDHFVSMIAGAIGDAQPGLPFAVLDKLSKGMAREIYKRAQGVVDENVTRMFAVDNLESVKADLVNRYGLSEDEASDVVRRLRKGSDASADPRAKRRVLMNEQFEANGTKLSDLLVNNATALTAAYAKHGWGKVALARTRVIDPKTGELLLDGITNDGDWNAALTAVRTIGHDNGVPLTTTEQEIEALQVAYSQIKGVGHPLQNEQWAKALRAFQRLNLLRLGHQFTFAQMGEAYNMLSGLSIEAMAKQVPSFRRIVTADGRWVKANGLDRWVESVFGLGADGIRLIADTTHADDLHLLPMEASGFWDHADHTLNNAGNAVLHLSGFHYVDGLMKQWTAKTIAQEFFDMAHRFRELPGGAGFDTSDVNYRRMAQLGLDDAMLRRVLRSVKDHAESKRGMFFPSETLTDPRLDNWTDQEARIAFESALMRKARRIIQENDIGSMHQWMPHPVWQMITQFRAFPIHAYDKQLMLNVAMHDGNSLTAAVLGAVIPTLIYSVQQHIAAVGRSDAGQWLDKRLDTGHLLGAAIQRHGWSSLVPIAIDTALPWTGHKPFFDARNTGQSSDVIFGNPTTSLLFKDAPKAIGGLVESMSSGRRLSQDELRDWHRLFGNNLITGAILNSIVGDRQVHPPRAAH